MYSNSSSILALRAKSSLHRHHHVDHCFSGDRRAERCGCCSPGATHSPCAAAAGFSDRGAFASPRFLYWYWLRQSALIRWAPSRIIISGGGGAARYRRLAAAWDGDPCAGGGWRRGSRCGGGGRVSCGGGVPDGSFREVLGLLAEVEECFWKDDGGVVDEEAFVKKRVGSRSYGALHRRICDDESDSSREGDIVARGSELSSSYQSTSSSFSSISGDSRRSKAFRRRGRDESSSNYGWDDEIAKKEVREVRKCEDDSRPRRRYHESDSIDKKSAVRIEDRKDNAASLADSVRRSREEYVRRDQRFTEQKESKEELQKVSKTSHVRQTSATGRNAGDKKVFSVVKEENSAADLLEEVRRQRNEIEQLRKDYQNLLGATQVHDVYDTKTSASCSVFNTRVKNSGETSALSIGLLEEVRRQRSEIEQLNENYQKLTRAYMMQESNMIRESNSTKTFGTIVENREESSISAVNLVEEGRMQYGNIDKQTIDDSRIASQRITGTIELEKYRQTLKTSDNQESDVRRNSNYKKEQSTILENREKKAVSAINLVEEVQNHHTNITQGQQDIRHIHLGTSSHKLTERADIHSSSNETVSRSQRHYVTRRNDQQEGTSGAVKLSGEREEKVANMNKKVSGHIDSSKNSQRLTDIVEIHKNDVTKALRTQDHVETTVKDQEESSTSVQHLGKLTRDERVQIDQRVIEEINVSKDTRSHINISEAFSGEADNASVTFSDRGKDAVSTLNLVHEVQRQWNEDGKQARQQLRLRNDSQQKAPEFFEGGPVNASDSHISSSTGTKSEDEYSSLVLVQERKEKEKINLVEQTFKASSGTSQSRYSPGTMQTHDLDYHTKSDGFHLVKDDVLESARRLDKSSSHYVGEFVDQLHQKISASEETDTNSYNSPETQMEASQSSPLQKRMATAENEDETRKKESLSQYSARSEVAGPSDEIWDVRGASSQEPSPTEEPEKDPSSVRILGTTSAPASSGGVIVKRSSKSLWSYIADIVRMGWRPNTSSQRSMLKSGTRSSSNESVNSDAWYSGHEQEDDQEENVKSGQIVTKKEPKLNKAAASKPHSRTSLVSGQVTSEVPRQEERKMQVELGASIPMEIIGGSYGSNGSPLAPSLENLVSVDGGKGIKGMPSAVATASPSALLGSTSVSNSEEEREIVHVAEVGFIKSDEEQKTERMSEVGGFEGKDVELKRRKLQRKKQVLREEFEEWEEAYKLETEQRKLDEIFMREALLEAKKAADLWEVPVGAVLVQDGKIIARGCNLVEDLRDSTAHAEMICIREASSLLRTWRLAGTTLYVTLEPCPMCAGAILQARIDFVVWGAPNKLLGADGSWVRLFPGGEGGKQDLDQSNQMVGPVHPFHPKITIRRGVLAVECADAMQQFFQRRRKKTKPEPPPPCLPINYPAKLLTKMHNIIGMMACM